MVYIYYNFKPIPQIYRVLSNSPAYKDGRLRKGDRILSVNGLSMRGLTHRESVAVLKTPRLEVVMVVTRSESVQARAGSGSADGQSMAAKLGGTTASARGPRMSLGGSLSSLHNEKSNATGNNGVAVGATLAERNLANGGSGKAADEAMVPRKMAYHKLSQSLDMDLDMMSNEGIHGILRFELEFSVY